MATKDRKNVVVIGGGTGTFTVLSGLKKYPFNLTAIVSMADDGGSTGALRDELGVLPPGDVRQCLVALSASDTLMRALMNYRFESGQLKGHNFGNLLLSALEKTTGSFDNAVEKASDILRIRGRVVPATLDKVTLVAKIGKRTVRGEQAIRDTKLNGTPLKLSLSPRGRANPKALSAIRSADAIVIAPGSFYTSLIPDLLVRGIPEAIAKSRAKKIFVCNLMTHAEHTKDFTVADFAEKMETYLKSPIDAVIYNNKLPSAELLRRYARKGDKPILWNKLPKGASVGADLISRSLPALQKSDKLRSQRTYIRHNPSLLARTIARILDVRALKNRAWLSVLESAQVLHERLERKASDVVHIPLRLLDESRALALDDIRSRGFKWFSRTNILPYLTKWQLSERYARSDRPRDAPSRL